MFKNNVLGLGGLLATTILVAACAAGEIGDSAGASRSGPESGTFDGSAGLSPEAAAEFREDGAPAVVEPSDPGTIASNDPGSGANNASSPAVSMPPACAAVIPDVSASNGWRSTAASQPAYDTLRFEFLVRPTVANLNGLVAVGGQNIQEFPDATMSVRFTGSGVIDARDGSGYAADIFFAYDPGVWYNIVISADISAQAYDVEVGRCGEPLQTLITRAAFRSDATVSDLLTTWAVWSSQAAGLELSTPAWVASGSCAPATCQSLNSECGRPSDGCGGSLNCGGCGSGQACASGVCVDNSAPPPAPTPPPPAPTPPPTPTPPADPHGRGPTGQWPAGFPAYASAAEIVTNGSSASLTAAINNAACSDGCVIEHAGNASGTFSSRASGSGGIVVRPPIGQRGNYTLGSTTIQVDGLLFAGYAGGTGQLLVQGNGLNGKGSGFAWIDMGSTNGGRLVVYCNASNENSYGFFYEILVRHYGSQEDRGGVRGYGGGDCKYEMVGSQIAGDNGPILGHPDTLQDYNPSPGTTTTTIRDSILWSSTDKVIQGEWPGGNPFIIDNSMLIGPSDSRSLWAEESLNLNSANVCVNAIATITNSTTLGKFNGPYVSIGDSVIYGTSSGFINLGGNTTTGTRPTPPPYPTDAQLDSIWSP